jgi:hypothetical protein
MALSQSQMARIDKGAAFLDEQSPGWQNSVNLDRLDVDCFSACVLCQVYGSYFNAEQDWFKGSDFLAAEYGFYPHASDATEDPEETLERTRAKTDYWKKLIQERLS